MALDRKRAEQMKMVEAASLDFFKAEESAVRAREQLEQAEQDRAAAVQALGALGVKTADLADMLGIESKEVRALGKVKLGDADQDELPGEDSDEAVEDDAEESLTTETQATRSTAA